MKRIVALSLMMVIAAGNIAHARVIGKEIEYKDGETTLKGYIVVNDSIEGKRPGVLVVHEWWGLNDYARMRAAKLAELGYTALAIDMYGNGKQAAHPDDAKKFSSAVMSNLPLAKRRFEAALKVLREQPTTDPDKIAAIGYCFGGGVVLNMARMGVDLDGVASFHGSLATSNPAKPGEVKAELLVLNGADDPFTTAEQIEAFKKEMKDAGVNYTLISYPGAKHAFTNPEATELGKRFNLPLEYNAEADRESWKALDVFLKRIFK